LLSKNPKIIARPVCTARSLSEKYV
jgi:hypothetical protein